MTGMNSFKYWTNAETNECNGDNYYKYYPYGYCV